MGQYHEIINLDKNFRYSAKSLGEGIKSMEQGNSFSSCAALALLLKESWNGERVFLIGDYAQEDDVNGVEDATNLYGSDDLRNVGWLARKVVEEATGAEFVKEEYHHIISGKAHKGHTYRFQYENIDLSGINNEEMVIVNYDRNEILTHGGNVHDMGFRTVLDKGWDNGVMTALFALLTASAKGGARGGGDPYHPLNGLWAGDRIGIIPANQVEDYYTDISSEFNGYEL